VIGANTASLAEVLKRVVAVSKHVSIVLTHFRGVETLAQRLAIALEVGMMLGELIRGQVHMSSGRGNEDGKEQCNTQKKHS
jgi:hypothetical protein